MHGADYTMRLTLIGGNMGEIELTQGYKALVDDEDYEALKEYKWRAQKSKRNVHAVTKYCISMHRFLLGVDDPKIEVDHKDHNGLNNQRKNLRICTARQNSLNQRKRQGNYSSSFKGIDWNKENQKWEARIRCGDGSRIRLGKYKTEIEAAEAYRFAAELLHGEFACV